MNRAIVLSSGTKVDFMDYHNPYQFGFGYFDLTFLCIYCKSKIKKIEAGRCAKRRSKCSRTNY